MDSHYSLMITGITMRHQIMYKLIVRLPVSSKMWWRIAHILYSLRDTSVGLALDRNLVERDKHRELKDNQ